MGFGELNVSVHTLNLPGLDVDLAGGLAIGTLHIAVALGGDFARAACLSLLAELSSQIDRLLLDRAVMRRFQKHALFGLFFDHDLGESRQKLLFFFLTS